MATSALVAALQVGGLTFRACWRECCSAGGWALLSGMPLCCALPVAGGNAAARVLLALPVLCWLGSAAGTCLQAPNSPSLLLSFALLLPLPLGWVGGCLRARCRR